ncbi:MAG: hypothetical protein AAGF44_01275 [Pseudomonadota bacterium]
MSDQMKTDLDTMLAALAAEERAARPVVSDRLAGSVLAMAADVAAAQATDLAAAQAIAAPETPRWGGLSKLAALLPQAWPEGALAAMLLGLMLGLGVGYGYDDGYGGGIGGGSGGHAMDLSLLTEIGAPAALADSPLEAEGAF